MHRVQGSDRRHGFSLIELVIVVVIIAIIGAIAIPRMSRGAAGAADSALIGDLAVLRNAIDLYAAEHRSKYPGFDSSGSFSETKFVDQLTKFSDDTGATSSSKTGDYIYGPYIRKVPALPVGDNKGETKVLDARSGTLGASGYGWYYNPDSGALQPNTASGEADSSGTDYSTY